MRFDGRQGKSGQHSQYRFVLSPSSAKCDEQSESPQDVLLDLTSHVLQGVGSLQKDLTPATDHSSHRGRMDVPLGDWQSTPRV
jgi:hypothetical protein